MANASLHMLWEILKNPKVITRYQQGISEESFLGAEDGK